MNSNYCENSVVIYEKLMACFNRGEEVDVSYFNLLSTEMNKEDSTVFFENLMTQEAEDEYQSCAQKAGNSNKALFCLGLYYKHRSQAETAIAKHLELGESSFFWSEVAKRYASLADMDLNDLHERAAFLKSLRKSSVSMRDLSLEYFEAAAEKGELFSRYECGLSYSEEYKNSPYNCDASRQFSNDEPFNKAIIILSKFVNYKFTLASRELAFLYLARAEACLSNQRPEKEAFLQLAISYFKQYETARPDSLRNEEARSLNERVGNLLEEMKAEKSFVDSNQQITGQKRFRESIGLFFRHRGGCARFIPVSKTLPVKKARRESIGSVRTIPSASNL